MTAEEFIRECPKPGYCPALKAKLSKSIWERCSRDDELGGRYRRMFLRRDGREPRRHSAVDPPRPPDPPEISSHPGSLLKWLIWKSTGIIPGDNCTCNARARQMDEWGWARVLWNQKTILGWVAEEACKMGVVVYEESLFELLKVALEIYEERKAKEREDAW